MSTFGLAPVVALDERDDHVGSSVPAPVALLEHAEGFADPGRRAQVHPQDSAGAHHSLPDSLYPPSPVLTALAGLRPSAVGSARC